MTEAIVRHPENAKRYRGIVILTLTVPVISLVVPKTVDSLIPTLGHILIAVTGRQVSVLTLIGIILRHPEYARRDKVTVIATAIVNLVLYVGKITVGT